MNCQIELIIEGNEKNNEVAIEEDSRECDGEALTDKEIELPSIEEFVEESNDNLSLDVDDNNNHMIFNIDDDKDTFGTFVVYIVRQNESINTILEKYHTTLEEVEKYNDVKNISIGTKLIIPLVNE